MSAGTRKWPALRPPVLPAACPLPDVVPDRQEEHTHGQRVLCKGLRRRPRLVRADLHPQANCAQAAGGEASEVPHSGRPAQLRQEPSGNLTPLLFPQVPPPPCERRLPRACSASKAQCGSGGGSPPVSTTVPTQQKKAARKELKGKVPTRKAYTNCGQQRGSEADAGQADQGAATGNTRGSAPGLRPWLRHTARMSLAPARLAREP